jgi:hypothetical protein
MFAFEGRLGGDEMSINATKNYLREQWPNAEYPVRNYSLFAYIFYILKADHIFWRREFLFVGAALVVSFVIALSVIEAGD